MSTTFQGHSVLAGACSGEALVTHSGFNTLASYQMSLILHRKTAVCGDQNNPEIYKKVMTDKILCLPVTIGSTTGGLVLQTAIEMGLGPKALLFSEHIDSLAAAGVILANVWLDKRIVVIDQLGAEFLQAVQTGQRIEINPNGTVRVID
jgi:uncharacterized protein